MAARKTHQLGPNQVMALKILASGPKTTRQMMDGLGIKHMQKAGDTMRSLRDRGLVHISSWRHQKQGAPEAMWSVGNAPDESMQASRKEERTAAQRNADYKQRVIARIGKGRWSAIQRAQRSKTASVLVIDGVKIWERGKGILV